MDSPYDPRRDFRPDFVALPPARGSWDEADRLLLSWRNQGFSVHQTVSMAVDPGEFYTGGAADGVRHTELLDRGPDGEPITVPRGVAVVPGAAWLEHLREQVRRALDAGAEGIWASSPGLSAEGGHSGLFKDAWQTLFQAPWADPTAAATAAYRSARLRSDLSLRAVDDLLRWTRDYGRQRGKNPRFFLALDSPLAAAQSGRVFAAAAATRLPVDGVVATLDAADLRTPVPFEGRRQPQPFFQAWLGASYFANLMERLPERPLYLQVTPSGGDEEVARAAAAAVLFFGQARGHALSELPEMPQASAVTVRSGLHAAVRELPALQAAAGAPGAGPHGIGLVTLDTLGWQHGPHDRDTAAGVYGLALPLLSRGLPVELVPGERAGDRAFLARFRVLLLSFDGQKPPGPETSQTLAEWVRAGGVLVLVGGESPFDQVGEWWSRSGYPSPQEHLLRECGVGVEGALRVVRRPLSRYRQLASEPAPDGITRSVTLPVPAGGGTAYLRLVAGAGDLRLGRVRVVEGGRLRADFTAGSGAERPLLYEEAGTTAGPDGRRLSGDAALVYRLTRVTPATRVELELEGDCRIFAAAGEEPCSRLQPVGGLLPAVRAAGHVPLVSYPLSGAEPLYRIAGESAAPAWAAPAGEGQVLFCGLPASHGASSAAGAEVVRALVRLACSRAKLYLEEGPLVAQRGPYVLAHALDRAAQLKGFYLDMFHPELPLLENPRLPYRQAVVWKQVELSGRIPLLLHASHRAVVHESGAGRLRVRLEGPAESWGTARVYPAGMVLAGHEAVDSSGAVVPVEIRTEGRTLRIRYPQSPGGFSLTLRWIRPEARLTK